MLDGIVREVRESEEWEETRMNLVEYGKEAGLAEGKAAGLVEGRIDGMIEAIFELLGEFGTVPEHLEQRIGEQRDMAVLSRWHKLAAKASSIQEFEKKM